MDKRGIDISLYNRSLYLIYPRCAPVSGSEDLERIQALLPRIEEGEGRTVEMQTIYQLIGLVVTLAIALISGALTGLWKIFFLLHFIYYTSHILL